MYTKRLSFMFYKSLALSRALGSSPIAYNPKTETFSVIKTVIPKVKRNFSLAVGWALLAFILVLKYYKSEQNLDQFHLTLSWWINLMLTILIFSIPTYFSAEFCDAGNGLAQVLRLMEDGYMLPGFNPNKAGGMFLLIDVTLFIFYFACIFFYLLLALYVIYDPSGGIFLGGYFHPDLFYTPVRISVIMFHCYTFATIISGIAAVGGPILAYSVIVYTLVAKELRIGRPKYLTHEDFRKSQNVRYFYRSLQIVHQHAMLTCQLGFYMLVLNAIFMVTPIYITFVLMCSWGELKPITKAPLVIADMFAMGYWTSILELGCLFYVGGNKTLGSWRRHKWGLREQNKVMKKFIRSCKLILFSYGNQFVVGRLSIINYYRGVVRGTFRTLLTLR